MKEKITPCLWFNNQANEAGAFYAKHFSDSRIVAQSPIVTEIAVAGQHITLLNGGPMYQPNPSISLFYTCETEAEIENIWKAFAEKGSVMMPLDTYPWSQKYGWIADQYGISWQFNLAAPGSAEQKIMPCLMFTGNQYGRADEAINHYSAIFKNAGAEHILRYGANEKPDEKGKVKQALLALNGQKFLVMESAHQHNFSFSEGVSLTIYCETQDEIDYYWQKLTESGKESMCGWLKDKFGVSWQVIPTILSKLMSDPAKAGKAAQAFMQMRKFDIEKLVQASI